MLDFAFAAGVEQHELLSQLARRRLHMAEVKLGLKSARIHQECNGRIGPHNLANEFEPLRHQRASQQAHAASIAAGSLNFARPPQGAGLQHPDAGEIAHRVEFAGR